MKKKRMITAGVLMTACLGISGTYAYYQDSVSVQNHISTGDVNIGIQEYQEIDGKETEYDLVENRIVLPSEVVSKIPRITNYAETCYVRAKVTHHSKPVSDSDTEEETEYILSDENINGISGQWIRKGEYYYYTEPLKHGASVDFFEAVTIPAEWTEASSGTSLGLTVTAEAIQTANFIPDFQSEQPWGDQEIEICVHEEDNSITEVNQEYQQMTVTYEGAARNLIAVPEDFFQNLDKAMPGDTVQDTFSISNTTDTEAEFFFQTETPGGLTEEELDLLKQFQLTISQNGTPIYSGDLEAASLNSRISLGTYQPGETGSLVFRLSLPAELKNAHAQRETFINWIFSVEGVEEIVDTPDGPAIDQMAAPKTGLANPYVTIPLLLAAAAGISTVLLSRRKEGNLNHEMEK